MKEENYVIRKIGNADISEAVRVIRRSFETVAEEFGFTEENAPRFTAFATTEERLESWRTEQGRPMYGCYEEDRLIGYYNLLFTEDSCELGSLSVLPEYRHKGIGSVLLEDAMIRAAIKDIGRMELSIVEENRVLRSWYESKGFIHTETKKFDFFPFTCGYLERDLRESPVRIENLSLSRGHIILWLEEREAAERKSAAFPRFVYISGELIMNGVFYPDLFSEWYWVEKPSGAVYFLDNLTVLETVTDEEKLQIIMAANERNKADEKNVQILFDPVGSARAVRICKETSKQEQYEEVPRDVTQKEEYFYGISRVFSTKNEDQYRTIGAFWDEMSALYGLENLWGIGYGWTKDSMSYAIGLKQGMLDDYDVEIMLPEKGWKMVKGRTEDLGRIYERIYADGPLDYEIETFTADGECEISFYRIGDAWLDGGFEVKKLLFDTVLCSAYIRLKEPDHIMLVSNFRYTSDSSMHWMDEASYGMCTHLCTKEEAAELYHVLKEAPVENWVFTGGLRTITVKEEMKVKMLELLRAKVQD